MLYIRAIQLSHNFDFSRKTFPFKNDLLVATLALKSPKNRKLNGSVLYIRCIQFFRRKELRFETQPLLQKKDVKKITVNVEYYGKI